MRVFFFYIYFLGYYEIFVYLCSRINSNNVTITIFNSYTYKRVLTYKNILNYEKNNPLSYYKFSNPIFL